MADKTMVTQGVKDLEYLSRDGVDADCLADGFTDASPTGNYEGSLEPPVERYDFDEGKMETVPHPGTQWPGDLEPDGFEARHGELDQYGFLRRPMHRSDVER